MEKINIAELLRDCPTGMELYSPIFGKVYLDKIRPHLAIVVTTDKEQGDLKEEFLYDGRYGMNGECMLFPSKGKTTWEGFQRPFVEGDIVFYNNTIAIFKEWGDETLFRSYVIKYLYKDCDTIMRDVPLFGKGVRKEIRFATEEEKAELFKAIKDNGYRWNPETKKMEKLIESKEDTDDKIVMSGIYFDREYYADEVELHLGNYEIEVRDGKIYAVFKNTSERLIEPKFKVGDKIKHKNTVLTIISVRTNNYLVEDEPNNFGILVFSQQDKWELINEPNFKVGDRIKKKGLDNVYAIEITAVTPRIYTFRGGNFQYVEVIDKDYELIIDEPKFKVGDRIRYPGDDFPIKIIDIKNNQYHIECFCDKHNVYKNGTIPVSQQDNYMLIPKFDIATLKPFDKVLVRDGNDGVWINAFFGFCDPVTYKTCIFVTGNENWCQCIPYEGNEHLLGTTNNCDEYFKIW